MGFLSNLFSKKGEDSVKFRREMAEKIAKQRIRLRYSPDMKDIFIVEPDNTLTPIRLLNKQENADIKREKVRLCRGEE